HRAVDPQRGRAAVGTRGSAAGGRAAVAWARWESRAILLGLAWVTIGSSNGGSTRAATARALVALAALALALVGCREEPPSEGDPCEGKCANRAFCDPVIAQCFCEVGTMGDPEVGCIEHADLCAEAEARV